MTKIFTKAENQAWSQTLPGKMCSACIAIRSNKQVLMVKASYKDHWTFPSGVVDANESPKSAAIRETYEEVGLNIDNNECQLLAVIYTASSDGDRDRFNFAFVTDKFNKSATLSVPNDEIEKAEWVNYQDVAEKSGNKGSYIRIQQALIETPQTQQYFEINPKL